ncbi:efflux RND transporter periplasmic adaptor subunit [Agrilutibacter solisilvae]|uniref:efflux RND transporter periplasmic adaptor subunit n=1 Tax=Agrilutibacter solisilvae TaxID=2763317 RepID=UPI001FD71958|nr:efflux RND transporter periplasmic adaptor subunit [Lysobacter solisilvae]
MAPHAFRLCLRLSPLLLCAALAACGKQAPAEETGKSAATLAVTTVPARTRELERSLTVSGPVAAVEEMQLGVEVSGLRVTTLEVDVGEAVRRGQRLLTLDHRMLDAELAQATAALREAEAGATLARANLARGEGLANDKYISATQLDELRAARTTSDARVGTARAARDSAALRRSFADLDAPAAGIISKRLVQPGQVVGAGQELLRLIRDGRLEWRAELPAAQLAQVSPGDVIELAAPDGTRVSGRVRAVSPGVDAATRTGTVYADLPQPQGLQPGSYLEGRIGTGHAQALVVPAAAVVLRDGFSTVFTVDAQQVARQVRVQAGSSTDGVVEILDGLKPGARVVVDGAGFLADGDIVRVVDAPNGKSVATP